MITTTAIIIIMMKKIITILQVKIMIILAANLVLQWITNLGNNQDVVRGVEYLYKVFCLEN